MQTLIKRGVLVFVLLLSVGVTNAFATHFRYGTFRWQVLSQTSSSAVVQFTLESAWRRDFTTFVNYLGHLPNVGDSVPLTRPLWFGDGQASPPVFATVTSVSVAENWIQTSYTVTHTYSLAGGAGSFLAYFENCCRISTLELGQGDNNFRLNANVVLTADGSNTASPASGMVPLLYVPINALSTFPLIATDPDGDVLTYGTTLGPASGLTVLPPGLSIDASTGVVTWDTTLVQNAAGALFAIQFLVTDEHGASVPIDMLLSPIAATSDPPEMLIDNLSTAQTYVAPIGSPVTFTATGTDPDIDPNTGSDDRFVRVEVSGAPLGASFVPSLPALDRSPLSIDFSWTPGAGDVGNYTVTFSVIDDTGLQDTNTATIIVPQPNRPPVITSPPDGSVFVVEAGSLVEFDVTADDPDVVSLVTLGVGGLPPGASFPIPVPAQTVTGTLSWTPTAADLGGHFVTFTAEDDGGLAAAPITVTIEVRDETPPVLVLPPDTTVEATSPDGAPFSFVVTATDDVDPNPQIHCSASSGDTFPLFTTTVHCLATDSSTNETTGSFDVTVVDTTPPDLEQPPDLVEEATGPAGAIVMFPRPHATDIVDFNPDVTCVPSGGGLSTFPLGTTTVTCTAIDDWLNSSHVSFDVIVEDTTPPDLTLPDDVTVEAISPAGTPVSFGPMTATDLVDPAVVIDCTPTGGSTFPLGTTTVECSAADFSGNESTGTFNVTVEDTTPPDIGPLADILEEATGPLGSVVTFPLPTATDIVDTSVDVVCVPPSGSTFPLGTTSVLCTATDDYANSSSASFDVTVQDTTPPALTVPGGITTHATSPTGAVVDYLASAVDLVDPDPTVVCAPPSGSTFPLGDTTVTCTAADDYNNSSSASFVVSVTNVAPVCEATPSAPSLWPPNHQLVPIDIVGVVDPNGDDFTLEVTGIFQDEPTNETGDGNTAIDGFGVGTSQAQVRAERMGDGDGRFYHIAYTATDTAGASCAGEVVVLVPHDQGNRSTPIDGGSLFDSTVPTAPLSSSSSGNGNGRGGGN